MWNLFLKSNSQKQRAEWQLPGAGGNGGDAGQRVQVFNCKMNKIWESNVQSLQMTIFNNIVLYT